ncbi:MAG: hypothetical protein H5T72_07145 [Actinobacteria bacterium]|nr:hypothetical protein [Actinomycetota bacterium]
MKPKGFVIFCRSDHDSRNVDVEYESSFPTYDEAENLITAECPFCGCVTMAEVDENGEIGEITEACEHITDLSGDLFSYARPSKCSITVADHRAHRLPPRKRREDKNSASKREEERVRQLQEAAHYAMQDEGLFPWECDLEAEITIYIPGKKKPRGLGDLDEYIAGIVDALQQPDIFTNKIVTVYKMVDGSMQAVGRVREPFCFYNKSQIRSIKASMVEVQDLEKAYYNVVIWVPKTKKPAESSSV